MSRILITGSAGFIGGWLANELCNWGHDVVGIDDFSGGLPDNVDERTEFYRLDLTAPGTESFVANLECDIVVHTSCSPHEGLSVHSPIRIASKSTVSVFQNVLVGAINGGCKRFVNFDSMAKYGDAGGTPPPFSEDAQRTPQDPYGAAKLYTEYQTRILCDLHGISWVSLTPHNVYGDSFRMYTEDKSCRGGMNLSDPYRQVLGIFCSRMLRGLPPIVYGDGLQKRSPSYIGNCIDPMIEAIFNDDISGECINIGELRHVTMLDFCRMVMDSFGWKEGCIHAPDRPGEVKNAYCTVDKSVRLLGYEDKVSLEEGIDRTVRWSKQLGPKKLRYLEYYEISNLVPRVWKDRMM